MVSLKQFFGQIELISADTELAKDIQSNLFRLGYLESNQDIDGIVGVKTLKAFGQFKRDFHLENPFVLGETTAKKLLLSQPKILVSRKQLDKIFSDGPIYRRDRYFIPLNSSMNEFEINTIARISMFLAQICHESGSLQWVEEIASGSDYEGRIDLGNTKHGDGKKYKGRGIIQLTGRANYRSVGLALGLSLEDNPLLAIEPVNSARIAGYFWYSRKLNALADKGDFKGITRKINGGLNGLSDRIAHLQRIRNILT